MNQPHSYSKYQIYEVRVRRIQGDELEHKKFIFLQSDTERKFGDAQTSRSNQINKVK